MTTRIFILSLAVVGAFASPLQAARPSESHEQHMPARATAVDAPPTLLLFAMAAGGIVMGRQLSRRKKREDDPDA